MMDFAIKLNILSQHLPCLTFLEMHNSIDVRYTIFILQHLNMLETLKINSLVIYYNQDRYCPEEQVIGDFLDLVPVKNNRLKDLFINWFPSLADISYRDYVERTERVLNILLQSCSVLEKFALQASVCYWIPEDESIGSCLNLSFINHFYMKEIRMMVYHSHYFALNDNHKYICYNGDNFIKYDPSSGGGDDTTTTAAASFNAPFHVNLLYNHKAVRLALLSKPFFLGRGIRILQAEPPSGILAPL